MKENLNKYFKQFNANCELKQYDKDFKELVNPKIKKLRNPIDDISINYNSVYSDLYSSLICDDLESKRIYFMLLDKGYNVKYHLN